MTDLNLKMKAFEDVERPSISESRSSKNSECSETDTSTISPSERDIRFRDQIPPETQKSPEMNRTERIPSLDETDKEAILARCEKSEITEAISKMEINAHSRTVVGEIAFCEALEQVRKLLLATKSRLSEEEKKEFEVKVRYIEELRLDWMKREAANMDTYINFNLIKRKEKSMTYEILLKSAELVFSCILLLWDYSTQTGPLSQIVLVFSLFAMLVSSIFIAFYYYHTIIDEKVTKYIIDAAFSFVFTFSYLLLTSVILRGYIWILGIIVTILYLIDTCYNMYFLMRVEDDECVETAGFDFGMQQTIPNIQQSETPKKMKFSFTRSLSRLKSHEADSCLLDSLIIDPEKNVDREMVLIEKKDGGRVVCSSKTEEV